MSLVHRFGRYLVFIGVLAFTLYGIFFLKPITTNLILVSITAILTIIGVVDMMQDTYAVRKNYPVIGNLRYLLKHFRSEIRQYFIEADNEAVPFTHHERNLVYARARNLKADSSIAFGTLEDVYKPGYQHITHSMTPVPAPDPNTFRITIGNKACSQPYSASILNISAMSFGALSSRAVESLNGGAKLGNFFHDTGEGGISIYHKKHGGDLVWELGSGYFGCRTDDGHFDPEKFAKQASLEQVKMIEIKISQGAKPGHGGVLPKDKITPEIAEARGVPQDRDCISPSNHSAFSTPVELLEFIQQLRELSLGKPVGFKLCVGHPWEFMAIAKAMIKTGIVPDFIVVDGKEGGTGSAPIEFADHIGMPLQEGLLFVHNVLTGVGLRDQIKIGASGKIITAFDITRILAMGADWVNSARGFMFALGCIQSRSCHTNTCPTGIATQDPIRQHSLVVKDKKVRVANFHKNTLHALSEILSSAGVSHPQDLLPQHLSLRTTENEVRLFSNTHYYIKKGALLDGTADSVYYNNIWEIAQTDSFQPNTKAM